LPSHPICLCSLDASASFDLESKSGILDLAAELSSPATHSSQLQLVLTDETGARVPLQPNSIPFAPGDSKAAQKIAVQPAKSWDAEHPNLYTLQISLVVDGQSAESLERKIGFRTIRRDGNRLLVNGRPVKLRGVCRHSIHPIHGRAVPTEFDEMDAALFRAANINFVRTSHYPPSEQFLEACDRHGIYVEEESAVCWSDEENGPSSNPEFTSRFISQFQEMVERDRDHASVLFWSLGNESQWGTNFAAERRFAAEHDPSRPVIFSYPDNVPLETSAYDIYSRHYADVNADLSSSTYPLLNDEFAHISCYNLDTLRRDPGIATSGERASVVLARSFSLRKAAWADRSGPASTKSSSCRIARKGYGPWGIIDGWRRPKPEYWLTAKAYSPIRIEDRPLPAPPRGSRLSIPITNAFDHTNLNEIEIRWAAGSDSGRLSSCRSSPAPFRLP
jgi:beta-galactosidase